MPFFVAAVVFSLDRFTKIAALKVLGLGASVGVVAGTGGAAAAVPADPLWAGLSNLYPLPFDAATVQAFAVPAEHRFSGTALENMAMSFHSQYVANNTKRLPASMRTWPGLEETFKKANREQAQYAVEILEAAGFGVRESKKPVPCKGFTDEEVNVMAEMEHGRWNVERLRDGWRGGRPRDDATKIHDCIVPWCALPEDIKDYDRNAVRAFPQILAQAGLEVYRIQR